MERTRIKTRIMRMAIIALIMVLLAGCATLPDIEGLASSETFHTPDSRFIEVEGISVHYQSSGTEAAGTPLVMLHGFMSNINSWNYITPVLAERSPVYAYDRMAFGLTERPLRSEFAEGESPYATDAVRERALELLDAWGLEKSVLVGNSAGGNLAVQLALAAPERVAALILIDPAIYRNGPPALVRSLLKLPFLENFGLRTTRNLVADSEELFASAWYNPDAIPAEIRQWYEYPLQIQNWDRALWEYTRANSDPGIVNRLDEIGVPVLIIHGRHDKIVPLEQSLRLADEIPGAELYIVEECGHVPQEECPEETEAVISDFLARHGL